MSNKLKNSTFVSIKSRVLYEVAEDAAILSAESNKVIRELTDIMLRDATIQGVSAPQIGYSVRIAICRYKGFMQVIQNPVVEWKFGSLRSLERCLSIPDAYFVRRPLICKISWTDIDGNNVSQVMLYKKARVFMHEIDHLNGKCITSGRLYKYTQAALKLMEKQKKKKEGKKVYHGANTGNSTKA